MIDFEICKMTTDSEMDEKGYVHWKSWHETYTGIMSSDYLDNVTLEKCVSMAHKFPQNTLLLKVNHKTVGFSCIRESADCNEIVAIYLLKEYHGKRLGYELMKKTVSQFANSDPIVLWVLKDNSKAIRFYERYGFRFDGTDREIVLGTLNIERRMIYERN